MSISILRGSAGALAIAAFLVPAGAQAQRSASTVLNVTAEVEAACIVSTTPIAFGTVDVTASANKDADGSLLITCTDNTTWSASAGVGSGTGATFSNRRMASGSNLLNYNIYTTAQRLTVFGDGTGGSIPVAGVGTGVQQTVPVYGRVPGGQSSAPSGNYADTVAVTVTY